ncbi:ATP-dependent RNA helicase dbp5 [Paraphysoderma sedebokerense]|nr:ATP-dependent RNA helicase dbp5 [Paraphysoderma sedebokerense]
MSEQELKDVASSLENLDTADGANGVGKWEDEEPPIEQKPKSNVLLESLENEIHVQLADKQGDPNSPLHSVSKFEDLGLDENLLKGLYAMKFTKPSRIQERALPLLLKQPYTNMIAQSQSGTGKTAAFTLTMLSRIDYEKKTPQAICIAPARELARQIVDVVKEMGQYTPVEVCLAVKDSTLARGQKINSHIIVGTPGTITDLIRKQMLNAREVKVFVLDEADNMLDLQGLGDQSMRIKSMMPRDCQILLFSATFPPKVRQYAARFATNANLLTLKEQELKVDAIKQFYVRVPQYDQKYDILSGIYGLLTVGQSIIFVHKKETADDVAKRMQAEGHQVSVLHGSQEGQSRDDTMDAFRSGRAKVLITTNVLARGIDIPQVNLVINYDLPMIPKFQGGGADFETYLHRIGRTGRFGRTGVSINFLCGDRDDRIQHDIIQHFGMKIEEVPTGSGGELDWELLEEMLKKLVR